MLTEMGNFTGSWGTTYEGTGDPEIARRAIEDALSCAGMDCQTTRIGEQCVVVDGKQQAPFYRILLRRLEQRVSDIRLDQFEFQCNGKTQPLSAREVDLLRVLLERRGEVVRREELLERVWGYATDIETRTLDTFIYRLRRKLERDPADAQHLLTVRGVGYKLSAP